MRILIGVIVCLVAILLVVVFSDVKCVFELLGMSEKGESQTVTGCVATFLGLGGENSKSEVLKFLGIAIAGLLLMLQAVIGDRRVKAMQRTAEAQVGAAKQQAVANKHTEDGQRQERLKNAIEHLGNESDSVRMGATYELFHLAQDTQNLRQTVLDILCAHIRTKTGECRCRDSNRPRPSVEIESLLNLLFLDNHEVFAGRPHRPEGELPEGGQPSGSPFVGGLSDRGASARSESLGGLVAGGGYLGSEVARGQSSGGPVTWSRTSGGPVAGGRP